LGWRVTEGMKEGEQASSSDEEASVLCPNTTRHSIEEALCVVMALQSSPRSPHCPNLPTAPPTVRTVLGWGVGPMLGCCERGQRGGGVMMLGVTQVMVLPN